MTIKSILCIFGGSQSELGAVNAALELGKESGAHVRFLHLSLDPHDYSGFYGEGIAVTGELIAAIEKESQARVEQARKHVATLAAKHHVPLDSAESPAHHASAIFRHQSGMINATIARQGRMSDLVILGRDDKPTYDVITPTLFNTARPVLWIPPSQAQSAGEWEIKTVAVAWDGSQQAARSLYNAFALIDKTEMLHVLTVREHGKIFDLEDEQSIMEYLSFHGFRPDISVVDRQSRSTGEALLSKAREMKADMLVMGAYGRSMFREMILGGVTEYMLENADIPLLLSH